jgi:hypothetical protein
MLEGFGYNLGSSTTNLYVIRGFPQSFRASTVVYLKQTTSAAFEIFYNLKNGVF